MSWVISPRGTVTGEVGRRKEEKEGGGRKVVVRKTWARKG
jgi:hypothetical protein